MDEHVKSIFYLAERAKKPTTQKMERRIERGKKSLEKEIQATGYWKLNWQKSIYIHILILFIYFFASLLTVSNYFHCDCVCTFFANINLNKRLLFVFPRVFFVNLTVCSVVCFFHIVSFVQQFHWIHVTLFFYCGHKLIVFFLLFLFLVTLYANGFS